MDSSGKEVHVQDVEEHVASNSMAASERNGDVGIEKQGDESEEETRPAPAIGAAAGASSLHPLVLEGSDSDCEFEDQTWSTHPSSSPEGALLHAVYFQLVGAGFDGMTVRELFRSRVRTWRKASEKAVAAALAEPEMEFNEEMEHQSMGDMKMPSRVGNQNDDNSNGEQLQQQMPKIVPRRLHVAARKTAGIERPFRFRFQGRIRTTTTRSLPPLNGVRTKTVVKNKGYLKNRLQGRDSENHQESSMPHGGLSSKGVQNSSSEPNPDALSEEASLHSQGSQ